MRIRLLAVAGLLASTGCVHAPPVARPDVPERLEPPADARPYLAALASGVQIYECAPGPDRAPAWVFKAPEATLSDRAGRVLGKHYAGPTWEAADGSAVVGQVRASDPGPNGAAIPWLLLGAKTTRGTGLFAATTFVQRVQTVGGVAPAQPCAASNLNEVARVPYTATYYFYRAAS